MSKASAASARSRPAVSRILTIVVLVIASVAIVVNTASAIAADTGPLGYLAIALSAAGIVVLLRYPYLSLILVAVAAPVAVAGSFVSTGIWSIACFAAFLFTLRGASALLTGAVIAASNFAAAWWEAGTLDVNVDSSASVAAGAAVIAASIGSAIRGNLRYRSEAEQRLHDLETNRAIEVQRGVAQERLRIARDLHDSVGHQVAVVNMHLGAAEVHLPTEATAAHDDLDAARSGVQAVLRETQQILRVLRMDDAAERSEYTYSSLGDLIDSYRAAGMDIEATVAETPENVAPHTRAAVFRIVQEGLTNAQKHGVGTVSVTVRHEGDRIHTEVVNMRNLRAEQTAGGNGLIGMRERAETAGGTLDVRSDERMFWVTAIIPASPLDGGTN
ncbi:sensor histidine kinase [Microbacterium saperdae]